MSKPKKVDNFTQDCTCENCGKTLHANQIWLWEEHFGCSQTCVKLSYYAARPELLVDFNTKMAEAVLKVGEQPTPDNFTQLEATDGQG